MEFSTHSIATPVSANTAIHMEANPHSPRIITAILIARANTMFCQEMATADLAIRKASGIADMLEVIKTTSAASMALLLKLRCLFRFSLILVLYC